MDIHGLSENHKKSQWTSMDLPCIALRATDWLIDGNKMIFKSFSFNGNTSVFLEYQTKSNSSSKIILLYSLKLLLEVKKYTVRNNYRSGIGKGT
jgi:hypothetical protein